jgi:hypothetical protein
MKKCKKIMVKSELVYSETQTKTKTQRVWGLGEALILSLGFGGARAPPKQPPYCEAKPKPLRWNFNSFNFKKGVNFFISVLKRVYLQSFNFNVGFSLVRGLASNKKR